MSSKMNPPAGGNVDIGYRLTAVVAVTFGLVAIAITMRMYARARIVHKVGLDDWLILFAVTLGLIASITELIAIYYGGLGRHAFYLTPIKKQLASKYGLISQAFCIMALCFAKVSICVSLLRIIQGTKTFWTRGALWGTLVLQFVVNTAVMICLLLQCQPTRRIWNQAYPGHCWNPMVLVHLTQLQGAVSVFSDWSLSLIPIWIIKNLQLDKRNKIILCFLMGLGILTGICAIVRTCYLIPYFNEKDPTWTNIPLLIWAGLERNVACIVACVPACRPIGKKIRHLASKTSSRYLRRSGYAEQTDPQELSNMKDRSDSKYSISQTGSKSLPIQGVGIPTRSQESMRPLNNKDIRKTTTIEIV